MSSAFQTTLKVFLFKRYGIYDLMKWPFIQGNDIASDLAPDFLAYGSIITLRSMPHGGGLLHSHQHNYPEELLGQQQVTSYCYKDENNEWLVKFPDEGQYQEYMSQPDLEPQYVHSGDRIRLEHVSTRCNLHSHAFPATIGM
jgi:dolichyl-phosphate-mannose-protein mannosyltransferase